MEWTILANMQTTSQHTNYFKVEFISAPIPEIRSSLYSRH